MVVHERGFWSDVVRDVLDADTAIEVRGEVLEGADVPDLVERADPDVVVWLSGDPQQVATGCPRLLRRCPRLRILAVKAGRRASVWRMQPTRLKLGELSLEMLVEEVRGER